MRGVSILSATTGAELFEVKVEEEWRVEELRSVVAKELKLSVKCVILLSDGVGVLEDETFLQDLNASQFQVLRKTWTVTVQDLRDEAEPKVLHIATNPDGTLRELFVKVAEDLHLADAEKPRLRHGDHWLCEWPNETEWDMTVSEVLEPGEVLTLEGVQNAGRGQLAAPLPASLTRRSEVLESNAALSLIDECQKASLLPNHSPYGSGYWAAEEYQQADGPIQSLWPKEEGLLVRLPAILSTGECEIIENESKSLAFGPQTLACFKGTRRYERLVVQDETLAELLWRRAKPLISQALAERFGALRPLGFGCAHGEWELSGLNHCFRVNSYGSEGFLKPHKDAPFSPNMHQRSLCTLLIPIVTSGSTRFYASAKGDACDFRGMTLAEEIAERGGLGHLKSTEVTLEAGKALIFDQGIIHEGLPDIQGKMKMVLRTDLMVTRRVATPALPRRLRLSAEERRDQAKALSFFREAQQLDLKGEHSNDLYERALSYRYWHPSPADLAELRTDQDCTDQETTSMRPWTAQAKAAPLSPNALLERSDFQVFDLAYLKGPVAAFRLRSRGASGGYTGSPPAGDSSSPPGGRTAGHLRAAAMYALNMLGHRAYQKEDESKLYTVDFDPATQTVKAVPLETLLEDAYFARACHGAVYKVVARKPGADAGNADWAADADEVADAANVADAVTAVDVVDVVERDFQAAVDRTHLALTQHCCPCAGVDLLSGMKEEAFVDPHNDPYGYCHGYHVSEHGDLMGDGIVGRYERKDFGLEVRESYCEGERNGAPEGSAAMASDWSRYLSNQLSKKAGLPGLDVLAVATGEERYLCEEYYARCHCGGCSDTYDPPKRGEGLVEPTTRVLNHLIFDFKKHELLIHQHEKVTSSATELFDPLFLWTQLLGHHQTFISNQAEEVTRTAPPATISWRHQGADVTLTRTSKSSAALAHGTTVSDVELSKLSWADGRLTWPGGDLLVERGEELQAFISSTAEQLFPWYTISLAELEASFHHAGENCGVATVLGVTVEHVSLAASDHTNTVLAFVEEDPQTGDALIWTIYHGLSAL
ncbi:unnamed protein product [Durusdinium trenchii]|uniref:Uncharacterized protein n=1 Tax=Durusdinium trenchii TaxID=1381693 RepID=A0ABP0SX20_9DINO